MKKTHWLLGALFSSLIGSQVMALTNEQVDLVENQLENQPVLDVLIHLKKTLKDAPMDKEARYLLSKTYLLNLDLDSADKELQRAKKLGVDQQYWMPLQAKIYLIQHQYEKLLLTFDSDAIAVNDITAPWLADLDLIKAQAHLSLNQLGQARDVFKRILIHHPSKLEALLGLTQSYLLENKIEDAERFLGIALQKSELHKDLKVDAQIQVVQASIFRLKNDLDSARIAYQYALNLNEDNLQARLGLTEIFLLLKDKESFIKESDKLFEKAPRHTLALYYHALALYSKKEVVPAIQVLEKLTAIKSNHAPAYLLLGYSYHHQKRYEMAAKTLQKYLELNPGHSGSQAVLASVMLKLKDPTASIKLLEPLVAKTPHYEWLALLGHAYVVVGQLDKGIDYLQRASAKMPQDPAIKVELAASLIANQENGKATDLLDDLVDHSDNVEADLLRLYMALKQNDAEKALLISRQLVSRDENNPIFQNSLGLALSASGKKEGAIVAFKKAIELAPKFLSAMNNLARVHMKDKNLSAADKMLDKALKVDPSFLQALELKSQIAELNNDPKLALKWLKTAQFRNPESFEAVTYVVSYHWRHAQLDKAYQEAMEGLEKFPKLLQAKQLVGQMALYKNDFDSALKIFNELNQMHPGQIQILQGLARAQLGLKQVELAQRSLTEILKIQQNNVPALLMTADILLSQQQYQKLKETANKIIAQFPERPIGHKLLGDASLGLGHLTVAVNQYKLAYEKSDTKHYARSYYRALKFNGKADLAFEMIEKHLASHTEDHKLRQFIATEYLLDQNTSKAKEHYAKVVKEDSSDYISLNNLAHINLQDNQLEEALSLSEKAYKLAPDVPQVADTYAWVLIQLKKSSQAVPILTDAIAQQPKSLQLRYHRAVGLFEMGDKQKAMTELERVLASDESFVEKNSARALLDRIKRQG